MPPFGTFFSVNRNSKMAFSPARLWTALNLGGLSVREAAERTWTRINDHEILTRAAAISFYAIAALVPFMALVISVTAQSLPWIMSKIGLHSGTDGTDATELLRGLLPPDALSLIAGELKRLRDQPQGGLISFGLIAVLWLSSSAFVGIIDSMNVIRGVPETRPFWRRRLIAILMTVSQAAILIVSLGTFIVWPQILHWLGLTNSAAILATAVHGLTVVVMILLSFALALYFGPNATLRWEWITPGSLFGTLTLVAVSVLFRIYVQHNVWIARGHRRAHELALAVHDRAHGGGRAQQGHRGRGKTSRSPPSRARNRALGRARLSSPPHRRLSTARSCRSTE
jgi:membrane protein